MTILASYTFESAFLGPINNVNKRTVSSGKARFMPHQVCDLFDISKATLFRWERDGVITEPPRDWRNWRLYTKQNVDEINKVIRARKIVV